MVVLRREASSASAKAGSSASPLKWEEVLSDGGRGEAGGEAPDGGDLIAVIEAGVGREGDTSVLP